MHRSTNSTLPLPAPHLDGARPWRRAVAEAAAKTYHALVLDVLEHASKFETTMAKRNKHANVRDDSLKIARQLQLDIAKFALDNDLDAGAHFPDALATIDATLLG